MDKVNLSDYRLTVRPGGENLIPKYGVRFDARFFDLDSLIRLYGEVVVRRFLVEVS